jgi:hypothetical protein
MAGSGTTFVFNNITVAPTLDDDNDEDNRPRHRMRVYSRRWGEKVAAMEMCAGVLIGLLMSHIALACLLADRKTNKMQELLRTKGISSQAVIMEKYTWDQGKEGTTYMADYTFEGTHTDGTPFRLAANGCVVNETTYNSHSVEQEVKYIPNKDGGKFLCVLASEIPDERNHTPRAGSLFGPSILFVLGFFPGFILPLSVFFDTGAESGLFGAIAFLVLIGWNLYSHSQNPLMSMYCHCRHSPFGSFILTSTASSPSPPSTPSAVGGENLAQAQLGSYI